MKTSFSGPQKQNKDFEKGHNVVSLIKLTTKNNKDRFVELTEEKN